MVEKCCDMDGQNVRISIVVATYNSVSTLADTLESILAQTYENYEVLLCDGASTDGTVELAESYRERFGNRLQLVSEKDNGLYDAMNKGLGMAQGDVVGILNSDDFYSSERVLERVAKEFSSSSETVAVYGDVHYVEASDLAKVKRYYSSRLFRLFLMRYGFMPAHPSFYCRRDVVMSRGRFNTKYRVAADFDQLVRLLYVEGIRTRYIPVDFVTMRQGGASNCGVGSRMTIMNEHREILRCNGVYSNSVMLSLRYLYKIMEVILSPLLVRTSLPGYIATAHGLDSNCS